tara:strand:+ start:1294 stop:4035 length:2742 start_codon:yes stop_codon:yes gene_type:complete
MSKKRGMKFVFMLALALSISLISVSFVFGSDSCDDECARTCSTRNFDGGKCADTEGEFCTDSTGGYKEVDNIGTIPSGDNCYCFKLKNCKDNDKAGEPSNKNCIQATTTTKECKPDCGDLGKVGSFSPGCHTSTDKPKTGCKQAGEDSTVKVVYEESDKGYCAQYTCFVPKEESCNDDKVCKKEDGNDATCEDRKKCSDECSILCGGFGGFCEKKSHTGSRCIGDDEPRGYYDFDHSPSPEDSFADDQICHCITPGFHYCSELEVCTKTESEGDNEAVGCEAPCASDCSESQPSTKCSPDGESIESYVVDSEGGCPEGACYKKETRSCDYLGPLGRCSNSGDSVRCTSGVGGIIDDDDEDDEGLTGPPITVPPEDDEDDEDDEVNTDIFTSVHGTCDESRCTEYHIETEDLAIICDGIDWRRSTTLSANKIHDDQGGNQHPGFYEFTEPDHPSQCNNRKFMSTWYTWMECTSAQSWIARWDTSSFKVDYLCKGTTKPTIVSSPEDSEAFAPQDSTNTPGEMFLCDSKRFNEGTSVTVQGETWYCVKKGNRYRFVTDLDNSNEISCEKYTRNPNSWRGSRCCDNDEPDECIDNKQNPDGNTGTCPKNKCFLRQDSPNTICGGVGSFAENIVGNRDFICDLDSNGNAFWSTRTKWVAAQLIKIGSQEDDYAIFCDSPDKVLINPNIGVDNYQIQLSDLDNIGARYGSTNKNVCLLKTPTKVIYGIALNKNMGIGQYLTDLIDQTTFRNIYGQECPITMSDLGVQGFKRCNINHGNLIYNPLNNILLLSNKDITFQGDLVEFRNTGSIANEFINKIPSSGKNFRFLDRLFIGKRGSVSIVAAIENIREPNLLPTNTLIASISDPGLRDLVCNGISNTNPECNSGSNNYLLLENQDAEDTWLDITAKLIKIPEQDGS